MRILFALAGLHRVNRGAEVAFEAVADEMSALPGMQVTLMGSGSPVPGRRYRFHPVGCMRRELFERWPRVPFFHDECAYEELTFALSLLKAYDSEAFDITVTCGFPFTLWALRAPRPGRRRPPHVFVTQNGDWPARGMGLESRFFGCEGLIALNPEYHERHRRRWFTALIPNGVDAELFGPGPGNRSDLGLPGDGPLALMVSALIPSKRVVDGIRSAARVPGLHLVVLGDGPERKAVDRAGAELMSGRYRRLTLPGRRMPEAYRCADLVLHMSREESFGNIYVEALATGLPVVAHDTSNTRWILEDQGVLVDSSDLEAVAAGIRHALQLRSPIRAEQRRRLAERRFSWRSIALQYSRFFEAVLGREIRSGRAPAPDGDRE